MALSAVSVARTRPRTLEVALKVMPNCKSLSGSEAWIDITCCAREHVSWGRRRGGEGRIVDARTHVYGLATCCMCVIIYIRMQRERERESERERGGDGPHTEYCSPQTAGWIFGGACRRKNARLVLKHTRTHTRTRARTHTPHNPPPHKKAYTHARTQAHKTHTQIPHTNTRTTSTAHMYVSAAITIRLRREHIL